jgi:hypothetical protein
MKISMYVRTSHFLIEPMALTHLGSQNESQDCREAEKTYGTRLRQHSLKLDHGIHSTDESQSNPSKHWKIRAALIQQ